MEPKAQK